MTDLLHPLIFKPADQEDSQLLTNTAMESKKMWGYTSQQMGLWKNELTITEKYIAQNSVFKIYDIEKYIGFTSLLLQNGYIEIDHLWLLPENTQKGYGRKTIAFIAKTTLETGCQTIRVCSEPYADGFYKKLGGKIIERKESKIKDRFLTVFEFKINFENTIHKPDRHPSINFKPKK